MAPETIMKSIGNLSLAQWFFFTVLPTFASFCFYFRLYLKFQWRFGCNLRRKVYFLKTAADKNLQAERDTIKKLGFFNIVDDIKDITTEIKLLQNIDTKAIYIIGYSVKYNFQGLFNEIKKHDNFVIIYAKQNEIPKDHPHLRIFNNYIYCDIANTTNRIAIILMGILKII
jgi:hypothetical protein